MNEQTSKTETATPNILERIAQSILIGYAWVSGPAMSEQQRVERELAKAHTVELELESTSIVS